MTVMADEIQSGLGRTGKFWAFEHWGGEPDMILMAKALSGGFVPVGAVAMTSKIMDAVFNRMDRAVVHGSTFSKNNMAMAAGLASLQVIEDEKLVQSLQTAVLKLHDRPDKALRDRIINDIWTLGRSNVTVYGTVYVKTNGKRLIAAFRIETGSEIEKWFTFEYALNAAGELIRVE